MKKIFFGIFIIFIFLSETVYADDYRWDLINAMIRNDLETIENILKRNVVSMSTTDKSLVMNFAMNYSSGENTLRVCQLLLKYNIRPNAFDLYTAINRNRQNSTIQFLLQNGAAPNGEILLLIMEKQRFDLARQFIEAGVDVNYRYPLSRDYADGMTPLLYASKWDNFEIVKLLVENGANINIRAVNGDTALSIARKNNSDKIINYLTEQGATEIGYNNIPLPNNGIANMLNNQTFNFQMGSYRLSGGNKYIKFTGNINSGNINYVDTANNRSINGSYRITGNNITIALNGQTFEYRMDSNETFSGYGEIWIRTGN
jgi:ankyrin repeat protein